MIAITVLLQAHCDAGMFFASAVDSIPQERHRRVSNGGGRAVGASGHRYGARAFGAERGRAAKYQQGLSSFLEMLMQLGNLQMAKTDLRCGQAG